MDIAEKKYWIRRYLERITSFNVSILYKEAGDIRAEMKAGNRSAADVYVKGFGDLCLLAEKAHTTSLFDFKAADKFIEELPNEIYYLKDLAEKFDNNLEAVFEKHRRRSGFDEYWPWKGDFDTHGLSVSTK